MEEDWKAAWRPLINAVGSDAEVWSADEVEKASPADFSNRSNSIAEHYSSTRL